MGAYEEKHALYREYLKELDTFREVPAPESEAVKASWCDDYISSKNAAWLNVRDEEGEMAGFLIIGKGGPYKHPDSDYSVAEAYIRPRDRKKGLLTKELSEYIEGHPGLYSLIVLTGNKKARMYWRTLFKKLGYTERKLDPAYVETEDVILLGFGPKISQNNKNT